MDAPPPKPIAYCAVEHGGTIFPDLLIKLVEANSSLNPYALLGIIKKMTCTGCAWAEIACDPIRCNARFLQALTTGLEGDHVSATFARAAKGQYTSYYDEHVLGISHTKRPVGELATLIADDLSTIFG